MSKDRRRTWKEFLPLLGAAIIDDLRSGADFFAEVAALANGPVITPLRALDIVAWHAGRSRIGAAIWSAPTRPEPTDKPDADDLPSIDPDDERP